jgi:hypothetical protein
MSMSGKPEKYLPYLLSMSGQPEEYLSHVWAARGVPPAHVEYLLSISGQTEENIVSISCQTERSTRTLTSHCPCLAYSRNNPFHTVLSMSGQFPCSIVHA